MLSTRARLPCVYGVVLSRKILEIQANLGFHPLQRSKPREWFLFWLLAGSTTAAEQNDCLENAGVVQDVESVDRFRVNNPGPMDPPLGCPLSPSSRQGVTMACQGGDLNALSPLRQSTGVVEHWKISNSKHQILGL